MDCNVFPLSVDKVVTEQEMITVSVFGCKTNDSCDHCGTLAAVTCPS